MLVAETTAWRFTLARPPSSRDWPNRDFHNFNALYRNELAKEIFAFASAENSADREARGLERCRGWRAAARL